MPELYDIVAPFTPVAQGGFGQVPPTLTIIGDPTKPLAELDDDDRIEARHPTNPANINYRYFEAQTEEHGSAGVPRFHRTVTLRLRAKKLSGRGDFFIFAVYDPFFAYSIFNIGSAYPGGTGYVEALATVSSGDLAALAAFDGEPMSVFFQNLGGDFAVSYAVVILDGRAKTHVRQRQRGAAEARARQRTTGRRTNQTSR